MSDWSWTIVDLEVAVPEARALGDRFLQAIADKGVIGAEWKQVGRAALRLPGSAASSTTSSGEGPEPGLLLAGVELIVGRNVFDTGGSGVELQCSSCGGRFEPRDHYFKAIDTWYAGNDQVEYTCPLCSTPARLTEWDGPYAFAFGNLGIRFWNWPQLSDSFISEAENLLGHCVRTVQRWG